MIRLIAFLILLGVASASAAETGHAHAMAPGQAEVGAQAAYDAQGILWAVHRVSGHIAVSRSEDDGVTWSNPVLVTRDPEPVDAGGDARPKIALGRGGEIYLTWTRPLAEPFTGEIQFARSLDGGRTFSAPVVVHHDRQVITHRFDALAMNNAGRVFVAWIDKRDLVEAQRSHADYAGAALYYAVSDDRGATFHGDFKVADHSCECCRIALAPNPDGTVTAVWRHIFAPNIRDHALATLRADGSATAPCRATFEDWRLDGCPHHGPAIAVGDDGRVHAVWFSGAAAQRGVFYGRLTETKPVARRRIGSDQAGHADVAVAGRRIAIVWKEPADGRTLLRASVSDDAGGTWRDLEVASAAGLTDHPRLVARGGQFFAFWNTAERPLQTLPVR